MSLQQQSIQFIPLNKLVASPRNVRRRHPKADIESLAASIGSRGLLQNLCVVPGEKGCFEVEAGGRRRLALKLLAKEGKIAKDWPVPCHVVDSEDGREVSLTENVHRVSMDAMDEVEAYAALVAEGKTPDEVARRFGVERRHVDQRLALAGLSPKIKAAWKRGDISLEAARAFCLVDDHARQEAVFRSLGKPVTHPASVRARLMEAGMRGCDRLAVYVGLAAYEAAGGAVVRDLFDEEAVYVGDPGLMTRLAEEKLQAEAAEWKTHGWGWVEVNLGQARVEGLSNLRLQPDRREFTDAEEAELGRLRASLDALDEALDQDSVEDDPRWDTRDTLAGKIEALRQSARVWDPERLALAGVVLSIGHDGEVVHTAGLVRLADEKAVKAIRKAREASAKTGEDDVPDGGTGDEPGAEDCSLPKALIRELSQARTRALRLLIMRNRDLALGVAVAAMITRTAFRGDISGVGVAAHPAHVEDLEAAEETRAALLSHLPEAEDEVLTWCLAQPQGTLMSLMALCVAGSVDLAHERGASSDQRRRATADQLAEALDLDMRAYWQPDAAYWARLPKSELMNELRDAPGMIDLSLSARDASLKAHAKLKKDELAIAVGRAFEGAGYLPGLLITPVRTGGLELTQTVNAAVAAE